MEIFWPLEMTFLIDQKSFWYKVTTSIIITSEIERTHGAILINHFDFDLE